MGVDDGGENKIQAAAKRRKEIKRIVLAWTRNPGQPGTMVLPTVGGDCPKTFLICEYFTGFKAPGGDLFVKAVQKLSDLQKFLDSLRGGGNA